MDSTAGAAPAATRLLHPALDFDPRTGRAAVGLTTRDNRAVMVMSDSARRIALITEPKALVHPAPLGYPMLAGRWDEHDLRAFLAESTSASFAEFLGAIRAVLLEHVEFSYVEDADLVAAWVAATYFHPLFTAFPRLNLQGGKGAGKSKVLHLVASMAFNGLMFVAPTAAPLFRLIEALRPSLALDEMEQLDKSDAKSINAILNAGYKAGALVPRVEGDKTREVVTYSVYAPIAIAGIKGLNEVLADRAITVAMRRATSRVRANREVVPDAAELRAVRSAGYRLALLGWPWVVRALEAVVRKQDEFVMLSGRQLELYRPLIALGMLTKVQGDGSVLATLSAFAARDHASRDPLAAEEAALFTALERRLRAAGSVLVYGADLLGELVPHVETAKGATALLKRYFAPGAKTNRSVPFLITREEFEARAEQHGYLLRDREALLAEWTGEPVLAGEDRLDHAADEQAVRDAGPAQAWRDDVTIA